MVEGKDAAKTDRVKDYDHDMTMLSERVFKSGTSSSGSDCAGSVAPDPAQLYDLLTQTVDNRSCFAGFISL